MFGAFKPSAPLSGGLLWKIPWRLSSPQKLRHRRRLRHVDTIVATLDTALQRSAQQTLLRASTPTTQGHNNNNNTARAEPTSVSPTDTNATPEELATTAEGQRLLHASVNAALNAQRQGRGPKQGQILSGGGEMGRVTTLGEEARRVGTIKLIERWKAEMPTEAEMLPRDKYTIFDRKAKGYRKGIHKLPKWTRLSQRLNPPGF